MRSILSRLAARPFTTVLGLSLALLLSGDWILPLLDRDEPRFAEAAREMSQRHDWVIPWLNGNYRFDKPPLIYWCQMGCYRVLGESALAARLPSVLFGTATALLLVLWGRRLGQARAGFYAGLMWITCLQVLIHGRMALADMAMVFFVATAVWTGWEMTRPDIPRRWGWSFGFAASLALGFLAKGPVSWLPIAGLALGRWWRPAAFRLGWWRLAVCLVVGLAGIALWGIPALLATHGDFYRVGIWHHVIDRSFNVMEGHGARGWIGYGCSLPLYFLTFFLSFFPWAFGVPKALRQWWPKRREDAIGAYLLLQAALFFAVFSFVRTKLPHYTLPALPFLALWLGLQTAEAAGAARRIGRGVVGMTALTGVLTLGVFSAGKSQMIAANLWREVRPLVSSRHRLVVTGFNEPSLVWEFRQGITNYVEYLPTDKLAGTLGQPGPCIFVLPTELLAGPLRGIPSDLIIRRASGYDTVQFKRHDLTALIRP